MSNNKEDFGLIIADWNTASISGYTNNDKLKEILKDIYAEIAKIDIFENELVDLLINMPSTLTYEIVYNTRFRDNVNFWNLLKMRYYDNFIKDVNTLNSKGENKFNARFNNQKLKNANIFYKQRLLTKFELELLFDSVKSKDSNIDASCLALLRNYKGENKYIINLLEAKNYINKNNNVYHSLMKTITEQSLIQLLDDLRNFNKCYYC